MYNKRIVEICLGISVLTSLCSEENIRLKEDMENRVVQGGNQIGLSEHISTVGALSNDNFVAGSLEGALYTGNITQQKIDSVRLSTLPIVHVSHSTDEKKLVAMDKNYTLFSYRDINNLRDCKTMESTAQLANYKTTGLTFVPDTSQLLFSRVFSAGLAQQVYISQIALLDPEDDRITQENCFHTSLPTLNTVVNHLDIAKHNDQFTLALSVANLTHTTDEASDSPAKLSGSINLYSLNLDAVEKASDDLLTNLRSHPFSEKILSLALSPEAKYCAVGTPHGIFGFKCERLSEESKPFFTLSLENDTEEGWPLQLKFLNERELLATTGSSGIMKYNILVDPSKEKVYCDPVTHFALSPDSQTLFIVNQKLLISVPLGEAGRCERVSIDSLDSEERPHRCWCTRKTKALCCASLTILAGGTYLAHHYMPEGLFENF